MTIKELLEKLDCFYPNQVIVAEFEETLIDLKDVKFDDISGEIIITTGG